MEFQQRFATEDACREYLFASRWPEGFVCPGCGAGRAGGETRRHLWVCAACGHQTSVTAGTVMHGTRTPLRAWFWAAYLVATHHPGISAKQLQRQLGLSRYETAWLILLHLELISGAGRRVARHRRAPAGAGQLLRSSEHALLLEQAVLGAFTTDKPCRRKANRPPGDAALTHAARLTGRDAGAVVVDLEDYAQIARVAR